MSKDASEERVRALYDGLNRRSLSSMQAVCHSEIELELVTGRIAGRTVPYRGHAGMADYLADLESIWDELLVTPLRIEERDGSLFVRGRVYARSRTLGIRDLPVAWSWEERDGLLVRGEVLSGDAYRLNETGTAAES